MPDEFQFWSTFESSFISSFLLCAVVFGLAAAMLGFVVGLWSKKHD